MGNVCVKPPVVDNLDSFLGLTSQKADRKIHSYSGWDRYGIYKNDPEENEIPQLHQAVICFGGKVEFFTRENIVVSVKYSDWEKDVEVGE